MLLRRPLGCLVLLAIGTLCAFIETFIVVINRVLKDQYPAGARAIVLLETLFCVPPLT